VHAVRDHRCSSRLQQSLVICQREFVRELD
jgi:hypothetical protein